MVSKKVEIVTKSWREGSQAVRWTCDGSPEYTIDEVEKADRGSDIILHIDDDSKDYLQKSTIEQLLTKYCKFMAVPVVFGKKTEWKDGKQVDTDEDNVINSVEPLWPKSPSSLKDEDYKKFYHTLFPMNDDPLFWIHLNVDYPFTLTGILYFPRIKSNIELQSPALTSSRCTSASAHPVCATSSTRQRRPCPASSSLMRSMLWAVSAVPVSAAVTTSASRP